MANEKLPYEATLDPNAEPIQENTVPAKEKVVPQEAVVVPDNQTASMVQKSASILDDLENNLVAASLKKDEQDTAEKTPSQGSARNNIEQNTNVVLDPFSKGVNLHRTEVFITPSAPTVETLNRLNSITKEEVQQLNNAAEWADTINQSLPLASFNGAADRIFARKEANWTQRIQYSNMSIGPMASRAEVEAGSVLSGAQAIAAAQRHLGIGGNFTIVLPHSGFWITFKPPFEDTILELHRQIHNIKTEVGRNTYGLMLNSYGGLINELFLRFALGSMQRNSIKDVEDLLKVISVHDINIIIWAYICTIYPNGFNHRSACIADTTKCSHIVEDIINVRRLFFIDSNAFDQEQLEHLKSFASSSMSPESVLKYRESLRAKEKKTIKLCEGTEQEIELTLRVPSAFDYFDSTNRWINGIGTKVIETLGADSSFNERNKIITEHAAASQMRKYAHWVETIVIGGGIINDRDSIEKTLDAMSVSIEVRGEYETKVAAYVEGTCFSLIGVPDYKCPHCGKYQITDETKDPLHRSIIGIDVPQTFFTMLVQRAQSVKE